MREIAWHNPSCYLCHHRDTEDTEEVNKPGCYRES